MSTNIDLIIKQLLLSAQFNRVRYPVFICGDDAFFHTILNSISGILLVSDYFKYHSHISWSQSKKLLGQNIGSLALDIRYDFDIDKMCLICGSVKGGELVLFLVCDADEKNPSRFRQRFNRYYQHPYATYISQSGSIHISSHFKNQQVIDNLLPLSLQSDVFEKTICQIKAIEAIKRVLYGHRRRPALLVSDRGRGKSSSLGIGAAEIMVSSKKHIIVTSPTISNVDILFHHAQNNGQLIKKDRYLLQAENGSQLQFIAPDSLLINTPQCDLLIVDEAAAIPLPMLDKILSIYNRIIFSSTEHGYEGSGRSFSLRFREILNEKAKGWKEISLKTPTRWAENDPLEMWLFDVFLFDAIAPSAKQKSIFSIRRIDKEHLFKNEKLLRDVFSLLVTAHYQTSPNDLIMLLDDDSQYLFAAFDNEKILGILVVQQEGSFDDLTARDVVMGKRRLKGHLLAQSIAAHTGIIDALTCSIYRIVRIAVLPDCTNQGIGSNLIQFVEAFAIKRSISFIGVSFGITHSLWNFWLSKSYSTVRLGLKKDAVSGTFSIQLLKCLTDEPIWFSQLVKLFEQNFYYQLPNSFQAIDCQLVIKIVSQFKNVPKPNIIALRQVELFSQGALGYDLVIGSLHRWFIYFLTKRMNEQDYQIGELLLTSRLLQQIPWLDLMHKYKYRSRNDLEKEMRGWVNEVFFLNYERFL